MKRFLNQYVLGNLPLVSKISLLFVSKCKTVPQQKGDKFLRHSVNEQETAPLPFPPVDGTEGFITDCLQVLNSASAGTAIYILSSLCPKDFTIVLGVLRIDLSQSHFHEHCRKEDVQAEAIYYADVISSMRVYKRTLSVADYSPIWLEVVQRWLFTCPLDEEYYRPDETGEDRFCLKLRGDLVDSILQLD